MARLVGPILARGAQEHHYGAVLSLVDEPRNEPFMMGRTFAGNPFRTVHSRFVPKHTESVLGHEEETKLLAACDRVLMSPAFSTCWVAPKFR